MCKLFGGSPSERLGIVDTYHRLAVDLACMMAFFEDENYHYEKSKETAGEEAVSMGQFLDKYKEQLLSRG